MVRLSFLTVRAISTFGVGSEDVLDPSLEQARDTERQRQAGVVLAGLDRVHGLARDAEPRAQFALRPATLATQRCLSYGT